MRHAARFVVCLAALAAAALIPAALIPAAGQTLESYAAALVRPPLEDQFGFDAPRWLRHEGPGYDRGWDGDGYGPEGRRGPGIGPDFIVYNCLGERRSLQFAVARLRPFGTLKLVGSGPGCTLIEPLRLDKPLRISGDKDATLLGPSGGPCLIVPPGGSLAIAEVRLRSWSDGDTPCIAAEGADVSLERLAIQTRGTALLARGGRLSLREVHLSGGPAPVLRLQHAEFAIVKASVESYGDGAEIIPPPEGIAQIDSADFNALGRRGAGLVLHAEGPPGARVVLDNVKIEDFVAGVKVGQGTRSVATHLHVGHAWEVGVEAIGSGLDLSNSVIQAEDVGVRLAGYLPNAPSDAPRILDNEINARGPGIAVEDGTPGEARNNSIGVRPGRCIVGASRLGDFRERENLCHPL